MKKLLICLSILLIIAGAAQAIEWSVANQATVAWDPIAYFTNGTTERIRYTVYVTDILKDPGKTLMKEVGKTSAAEFAITFSERGSYVVGVKSVVEVNANGEWYGVSSSAIGWSDDPTIAKDGNVFGIRFYPAPNVISGLRIK